MQIFVFSIFCSSALFPLFVFPQLFLSDSYPNLGRLACCATEIFSRANDAIAEENPTGKTTHPMNKLRAGELPTKLHPRNQAILTTRSHIRRNITKIMETSARALAHGIQSSITQCNGKRNIIALHISRRSRYHVLSINSPIQLVHSDGYTIIQPQIIVEIITTM